MHRAWILLQLWEKIIQGRSITSNLFLLTYHMISLHNRTFDLYPPLLQGDSYSFPFPRQIPLKSTGKYFCNPSEAREAVERCV